MSIERSKTMFQRILVPLDGSERAERAIPVAARIARASCGTVVFLQVVPPANLTGVDAAHQPAGSQLEQFETERTQALNHLKSALIPAYAKDLAGIATEMQVDAGAAS